MSPLPVVLGSEPRTLTLYKHTPTELQTQTETAVFLLLGFGGGFLLVLFGLLVCLFLSQSHYAAQVGLEFRDPLASVSQVLRSNARIASFILTILETRQRQGPHP